MVIHWLIDEHAILACHAIINNYLELVVSDVVWHFLSFLLLLLLKAQLQERYKQYYTIIYTNAYATLLMINLTKEKLR